MRIFVYDHGGYPFPLQLSRELARRGHQVAHSFCAQLQTPHGRISAAQDAANRLEIWPIQLAEPFHKYRLLKRGLQERELGRKITKKMMEFRPHVLLSGNTPLITQSVLLRKAQGSDIRFVFWLQDILGIGILHALRKKMPFPGNLIGHYFIQKEYALLKQSDAVIAISEDFLSVLSRAGVAADKSRVIRNWAPLDELPLAPKSNEWSVRHRLDRSFNFLYSGTLGMKHNPERLKELAVSFRANENIRIVVISEGLGAEFLRKEKETHRLDNLILLPFQPYRQLAQVLSSADVLVGLLEKEAGTFSVPSKILTYLCMKKPLLLAIPQTNLAAKIVQANQAGCLCPPDDIDSFLKAADRLYQDKNFRDTLARNGFLYAQNTFTIETITDSFESILLDPIR